MITKIISFLILIFLGFFLKKIKFLNENEGELLRKILFNVSLPSLVIFSILTSNFSGSFYKLFFIVPVSMIIQFFITFILGSIYFKDKKELATLILICVMGNTAFLGYPLVEMFFGTKNLPFGIFYDQVHFYTFLIIIYPLISYISRSENRGIKSSFITPPVISFLISLILRNFTMPQIVIESLNVLKQSVTPLVLLYLGINLDLNITKKDLTYLIPVIILKLILLPYITFFVTNFFKVEEIIKNVSLLQSMMPTMMATIIFGSQIGLNKKIIAKAVGITTIFSSLTISILSKALIG
ncbi:MAG: AEC family transporter [Caldisericia bacterium]|nr:AEC family transporter [Caldisericia bacterium]